MKVRFIAFWFVLLFHAMSFGQGLTQFSDDFSKPEEFAQNWVPIDSSTIGVDGMDLPAGQLRDWGPGIIEVVDGTLQFQTTNPVPLADPAIPRVDTIFDTLNTGFTGAALLPTFAEPVADAIVRTKVRVDSDTNAAVLIRSSLATLSNYNLTASGPVGKFALSRFENGAMNRIEWFDVPSFSVGEDWWMEIAAIGQNITGKAWRDGTVEPETPQFRWVDDVIAAGEVGLVGVVQNNVVTQPTRVNATFDDFSLRVVPEPSSMTILLVALAAASIRRYSSRRPGKGVHFVTGS